MAGAHTQTFDDSNFETEVLNSNVPVLVDFWAEWCMPCRNLAPTIDELATEYAGRIKIGKMDTDKNSQTAMKYDVTAIPTLVLIRNGQEAKRFVGMTAKRTLKEALDAVAAG